MLLTKEQSAVLSGAQGETMAKVMKTSSCTARLSARRKWSP